MIGGANVWDEDEIGVFILKYNGLTLEEKAAATKGGS